jgi:MFS family permease
LRLSLDVGRRAAPRADRQGRGDRILAWTARTRRHLTPPPAVRPDADAPARDLTTDAMTMRRRWVALVVLCVGQLMIVLDATVVNVALPSIQHDLHATQTSLAWVINGYLIAFGGLLLLAGRLGDLLGRKRLFLAGVGVFTVASMLCGLAPNEEMLVAARFRARTVATVVAALLVAFAVIQPSKTGVGYGEYNGNTSLVLPARILGRLDMVGGLTDAAAAGPNSYMSVSEFAHRLLTTWTPQSLTGDQKVNSGILWGQRMEGLSSNVYLAEGPTAEGYAIDGVWGVIAWNAVLGAAAAVTASALQRKRRFFLCMCATALLASNALFERGILGLNEALSASVQLALVGVFLVLLVRGIAAGDHSSRLSA